MERVWISSNRQFCAGSKKLQGCSHERVQRVEKIMGEKLTPTP